MKHMWMWTSLLMLGTSQKVCHSEKGRGVDKWLKTDVTGNCAVINISFCYNFLCLSLQFNFSTPIMCMTPIILQWNNKNPLKRPSQTWLWKGYMTSSKKQFQSRFFRLVTTHALTSSFEYSLLLASSWLDTSSRLYSKPLVKAWVVTNLKKKHLK